MTWEIFLAAILWVECKGDLTPVDGDNGRAWGPYQIHEIYVRDVNEFYGTTFTHEDCRDPEMAREIVERYLSRWGRAYHKKTGEPLSYKALARMHNGGGPTGYNKQSTLSYWADVTAAARRIKKEGTQ